MSRDRTVWLGREAVATLRPKGELVEVKMSGGRFLGETDEPTALLWIAEAKSVSVGRLAVDAGDLREMLRRDR